MLASKSALLAHEGACGEADKGCCGQLFGAVGAAEALLVVLLAIELEVLAADDGAACCAVVPKECVKVLDAVELAIACHVL